MMAALVAGVPMPSSFTASRACSSAISPAAGLHGRQQRGFGIERSGHGLLLGQSESWKPEPCPLRQIRPYPRRFPARHPPGPLSGQRCRASRADHGRTLRAEVHPLQTALHEQHFLLAVGRERLQHTSGYQRIDGLLRLGKPFGCDAGRDEGMVVRHFPVVHAAGVETRKVKDSGTCGESGHGHNPFPADRAHRPSRRAGCSGFPVLG